jgi:hypothetical protein
MHGHVCSSLSHGLRDAGAKPARRTRDQRGFTLEIETVEDQGAVLSVELKSDCKQSATGSLPASKEPITSKETIIR